MITRKIKIFYSFVLLLSTHIVAQSVVVTIGSVSVDGYAPDIEVPIVLMNPNDEVGGIQFDIEVLPDMVTMSGADAVDAASGFTADYNSLGNNIYRVVLFNAGSGSTIAADADTVMTLHFDGASVFSAQISLLISGLVVSDSSGGVISSTGSDGYITMGYVVSLALSDGTGDVEDTVSVTVDLDNGSAVGGVQFDLLDSPDYVTVSDISTTDRTTGFTITTADIGSGIRILLYSDSNDNISAGTGPIINIGYTIHNDAYAYDVNTYFENVVVSDDIGGVFWISELDSGIVTVYPGYMEEPHNLIAISGLDSEVQLNWDPPVGATPPVVPFTIEILTDDWPSETYWDLIHLDPDTIVLSIGEGELTSANTLYTWDFELVPGAYTFTIYDAYGDGICCGYAEGYYRLILDGNEIANGGEFGASESFTFNTSNGIFNRIQYNYLIQLLDQKESDDYKTRNDFNLSLPVFIESGQFEIPSQNIENTDQRSIARDIPVSEYNIFRKTNFDSLFYLITSVSADVTTFTDGDVSNGSTYYYYVTADYSPDGTQSAPSNIAEATPVEWIEISISDGEALSGMTDTLDIYINNESDISFFYFEIEDTPNLISPVDIIATDRTSNWSLDVSEVGGIMVVTGLGLGNNMSPGSDAVCRVIVLAASQDPVVLDLSFSTASVQDANGNELIWTAENSTFDLTVETQFLVMPGTYGNPGEMITIPLLINNSQKVYGVQVFLTDNPDYVSGIAVAPTNYHDFSNWTIDGNNVGNEYRVVLFNTDLSNPLPRGSGHIADISLYIDPDAPTESTLQLSMEEVVIVDQNNIPMHVELSESKIYIGVPDALYKIGEVNESSQTITIDLENSASVYVTEILLADIPNGIEITNVSPAGRFEGSVDGQTGETENGLGYILMYDLANGIAAGSGPILEIEYNIKSNTGYVGDVISWLMDVSSADSDLNSIPTAGSGFAILDVNLALEEDIVTPTKFVLHPAYPNPFNPVTHIIYDLPQASYVNIRIYDLTGREIRSLLNSFETAGIKTISWDGKDNYGREISAGVYIYRLEAGGYTQSRKAILLK